MPGSAGGLLLQLERYGIIPLTVKNQDEDNIWKLTILDTGRLINVQCKTNKIG